MSTFQRPEVVDRGSETQPQVVEILLNSFSRIRIDGSTAIINILHFQYGGPL